MIRRFLRGPAVSRVLKSFAVDPGRYWLLMDLFGELTERREMFSQLGRDGMALRTAAWLYFFMAAVPSLLFLLSHPPAARYSSMFLVTTAFLLLTILLPETSNSLVNPVEGLVLAHQPVNGATYTAAKLTHLFRVLLYLVPGLNAVPALAGLMLEDAGWSFPFVHVLAAFGVGLLEALLCCAAFGWLLRMVHPTRLRAADRSRK